jgi:hypothetical protein
MEKLGMTIKMVLNYGEPSGRISCELSNWSCKANKIDRINAKEYCMPDLNIPHFFFLFGKYETGKGLELQ